jgi:replicative DNA helicase
MGADMGAADRYGAVESGGRTVFADSPADYLLNGLVRLLLDGKAGDARSVVARAGEELLVDPVDRDLFRAIHRALDYGVAPGPLDVKLLIEHDDAGGAPVEDVVNRLADAVAASASVPWDLHTDSAIRHLRGEHGSRQARELGRELVAAADRPTPERCDEIIRAARQVQDRLTAGDRAGAATLTEIIERWRSKSEETLLVTGFAPIDTALGGGLPVGIHGIAAAPKAGKSALALQIAAGSLLHNPNARIVWMRGEMTNDLLFSRLLACWSQLRGDAVYPITLRDALRRAPDATSVYRDMMEVVGDRLVVVDPPITPSSIERWIDEVGPALVVVDYLQRVEVGGFKDRRTELDHAMRRIGTASTRADIPIVVVSSVAKGTTEHSEIGAITKESNQLEFDCHTYWSLWTQGDRHATPRRVLLKNNASRSDQTADNELWFHGASQFYERAAAPIYEEFGGFAPR